MSILIQNLYDDSTFSVSKAPVLSAISINLPQRPFKEIVKQTQAGNV